MLLLDTNVVSVLFKPGHPLYESCFAAASGRQLFISFMTRAELGVWPKQNAWGSARTAALQKHIDLCTTLFPDEQTCVQWAKIVSDGRSAGRTVTTADAWIAATAIQSPACQR